MTGSQFKDYVLRVFKRTDKSTEIYDATTDVIADIRLQIKADDYKEEAFVTGISTLGEYRIALPSDFGHLIGDITVLDDTGNYVNTLHKINKSTYDEKYGDRLFSNLAQVDKTIPQDFCIFAGQIYLGAVPDKTTYQYHMNYTTEAFATITDATAVVPFTARYRNTLRAGVLGELYMGMEQFDEASVWIQKFNEGVLKIKANDDDNMSNDELVAYHGI